VKNSLLKKWLYLKELERLISMCVFENYLTDIEISAFSDRINTLIASGTFPLPSDEWPAIPWPPV